MLTLEEAWNQRQTFVPDNIIKVVVNQNIIDCLERTIQVLSSSLETLKDQDVLQTELFVLSRFISRRKAQLRRHKTRQVLGQVVTCLKRFEDIDLGRLMTATKHHFIKARNNQQKGSVLHLPSQGMFQYVLVRLIGAAAVLVKSVNYCMNATVVLQTDVSLAHLLPQTMMCLAAVSRVWACCRSLYLDCVSWYTSLLPQLQVLPKGQIWLFESEVLPVNLPAWLSTRLDMDNINKDSQLTEQDTGSSTLSAYVAEIQSPTTAEGESDEEMSDQLSRVTPQNKDEDIGAPVQLSREDLGIICENVNKKKTRKKGNSQGLIVSVKKEKNLSDQDEDTSSQFPSLHVTSERFNFGEDTSTEILPHTDENQATGVKRKTGGEGQNVASGHLASNKKRKKEFHSDVAIAVPELVVKEANSSDDEDLLKVGMCTNATRRKKAGLSENQVSQDPILRTAGCEQSQQHQVKEEQVTSDEEEDVEEDHIPQVTTQQDMSRGDQRSNQLHLKILKQEITQCENVKKVVDIFRRLKPENVRESRVWDDWPSIAYQDKQRLFNRKLDSIQQCIHNSAKKKRLSKAKVHCFRYMKEINELTKSNITDMMTSESLRKFVDELRNNKITWLGESIILSPRKAKVLGLEVESFHKRILKVKNSLVKVSALKKKVGELILRSVKPSFER